MIVMKFGGSSLESAQAMQRVTKIVQSHIAAKPVVVVSAMGETTDTLLSLAGEAERGRSYLAWKGLKELWEYHAEIAAEVCSGDSLEWLDQSLHQHFNRLHRLFIQMEDDGERLTPALRDEIASYGERISSEIVAGALQCAGVPAVHLDSRQLIVTDDQFTNAKPLYWETYAKLRRVIPCVSENRTVVMGGFIGATEAGATTTLGRGGSDWTASIVGAGINADEIQIWTDVDGMLTCDPSLHDAGYRVKAISYGEAAAMAQAGARVLHPETMTPAVRQRIPLSIRNSRRPEVEGTQILSSVGPCLNRFKSIASRQQMTLLAVRMHGDAAGSVDGLKQLCGRLPVSPELLATAGGVAYLGIKNSERFEGANLALQGCVEARLHRDVAVLTLVGGSTPAVEYSQRVLDVLKNREAFVVCDPGSPLTLMVVVPQCDARKAVETLHREFFAVVDPAMFAAVDRRPAAVREAPATPAVAHRGARALLASRRLAKI